MCGKNKTIKILYIAKHCPVGYTTSDAYYALPNWLSQYSQLVLVCPAPPDGRRIPFEKNLVNVVHFEPGLWQLTGLVRTVARLATREHWDVIITGIDEISLLPGIYASAKRGYPLIAVCEDHPFGSRYYNLENPIRSLEKLIRVPVLRALLRRAARIFCFIEKDVINFLKIPERKILQMRNGVDDSVLSLINNGCQVRPFSIGYIGAVEESKGSLDMLAVVAKVRQRCTEATLTLVGPYGSDRERLTFERECTKLGLSEAVKVTGYMGHSEALKLLQTFSVCVHAYRSLPWLYYNQALKVAEYMAIGKAVVSWNYPGVRRLLDDGRAGVLIEPDNLDLMAEGITRVLTKDRLRGELQNHAYASAANRLFWSKIGQEVLEAISNTILQGN